MIKSTISAVHRIVLTAALATSAIAIQSFHADEAFAQGNSNGNGNGNGNRNSNADNDRGNQGNNNGQARANNGNSNGNNGRGAIARELQGLNAVNANPTALANAAPNSMPGKLYAYQQSELASAGLAAKLAETIGTYEALQSTTPERFVELNPTLDYATTLAAYAEQVSAEQAALDASQTGSDTALASLTGGRTLSAAAMTELRNMLGL